jgi:hypothetical protein
MAPFSHCRCGVTIRKARIKPPPVLRDRNTIRMVADFWLVTPPTVKRRIADGTLECLRFGDVVRITREQVLACEARYQIGPRDHAPSVPDKPHEAANGTSGT